MPGERKKRKRRLRVLTKSRTSPDPSEESEASLGEFGETKVFGTGTAKKKKQLWTEPSLVKSLYPVSQCL